MWAVACVVLAVAATWLALSDGSAAIRRLHVLPGDGRVKLPGFVRGRPGALPLKVRVLAGCGAALAAAVLLGQTAWLGLAAGAVVTVGLGYLTRPPKDEIDALRDLPKALALLGACLEAGSPMRSAAEAVAAVSVPVTAERLGRVTSLLAVGVNEADAWAVLVDDPVWGPPAKDLARSARSGTSLIDGLRVHGEESRRRAVAAVTKQARQVGVKSVVPLMACFLPAFVLVGVIPIIGGLIGGFFSG